MGPPVDSSASCQEPSGRKKSYYPIDLRREEKAFAVRGKKKRGRGIKGEVGKGGG